MAKVAIMGYGTVGSGVYDIIKTNSDKLSRSANGESVDIKYILDIRDFDDHPEKELFTKEFNDILNDDEVSVVAEVMGGLHPAYEFTKSLLEAGKSVVTSNKELVATYGTELLEIARGKNVNYFFEASVGGGIPIIRPMHQCLTANNILKIAGILNGTTNYILSKMQAENADFEEVLKEAQEKGYAERNPEADVEGYDACRKIAILTSLVCGQQVDFQDIHTEGITKITATDIKYAKALGRSIKLLASSYKTGDSYCALVAPFMLAPEHPLYNVNDVFNAVFVHGNVLGDAMFYGSGAGKLPTASAVVGDIVEIARHLDENIPVEWREEKLELADYKQLKNRYFVRTTAEKAAIEQAFGAVEYVQAEGVTGECAFITAEMDGAAYDKAEGQIGAVLQSIRVK